MANGQIGVIFWYEVKTRNGIRKIENGNPLFFEVFKCALITVQISAMRAAKLGLVDFSGSNYQIIDCQRVKDARGKLIRSQFKDCILDPA